MTEEFPPYGAEVAFTGDAVDESGVPYTVTYSVTLITEQSLVLVAGADADTGSASAVLVLSGDDVVELEFAAMLTSGGGP